MRQLIPTLLLVLSYGFAPGQSKNTGFSKITTVDQAKSFIESNPKYEGKLFAIKSGQDAEEILSPLRGKKTGYVFNIGNCSYKIVKVDSTLSFRVSYIYLDGTKRTKEEIDNLRREIISKFKSGEKFGDLAAKYNMDGNTTCDTNWFSEKTMVDEFENEVKAHKKGDIFTVDTPRLNWYHVVLKTYDDSYLRNLTILKITNNR